jgi:hypothetical protein
MITPSRNEDKINSGEVPVARVRPHPDVIVQLMGDEIVLLHLRTDQFYELNRTAARLWDLLSAGYTPVQIKEQMALEYEVDPARLASEIEAILSELKEKDLVVAYE